MSQHESSGYGSLTISLQIAVILGLLLKNHVLLAILASPFQFQDIDP